MSRTFQDRNFLVWEVYPSSGRQGLSTDPHLVFHCLTRKDLKPRWAEAGDDEAEAERRIEEATNHELLEMLDRSQEIL
jgi:hypothetical protein